MARWTEPAASLRAPVPGESEVGAGAGTPVVVVGDGVRGAAWELAARRSHTADVTTVRVASRYLPPPHTLPKQKQKNYNIYKSSARARRHPRLRRGVRPQGIEQKINNKETKGNLKRLRFWWG